MAVFSGSVYSEMLNMDTHLVVILPEKTDGKPLKSLYLLHGYSDDCTSWQRNGGRVNGDGLDGGAHGHVHIRSPVQGFPFGGDGAAANDGF